MCSKQERGPQLEAYPDNPRRVPDESLERGIQELARLSLAVEAKKLRWIAEAERRAVFRRDGYVSSTDWLSDRLNLSRGAAKEQLKTAQVLEAVPEVKEAMSKGDVSASSVRVLTAAWESHPEAFEASGSSLVEGAKTKRVGDLRRTVDEWRHRQDQDDGREEARKAMERRGFDICPTASGMVGAGGRFDPEGGEYLLTAVQAAMDADVKTGGPDFRTPRQRRADALVELARRYLDSSDRPSVGGERPHVTVTVGLDVLRGTEDGRGELDHGSGIHKSTARRLACDASVRRIVLGPRSEPLDVGRKTPVVPAAVRRAVIARDRTCRFSGCGRPASWCDVHHIKHWADGGETSLANCVLLCRRHHHLIHEKGFSMQMTERGLEFRRPDGSVIQDNRAPP